MKSCYVMFKYENSIRIEQYYRPTKRRSVYKDLKRGFISISLSTLYGYKIEKILLEDVVGYRKNKKDFEKEFPQYFI